MKTNPAPPAPSTSQGDPGRERDAAIIANVAALVHSRRKGDYLKAADAHEELGRLGVLVKFRRQPKAAAT